MKRTFGWNFYFSLESIPLGVWTCLFSSSVLLRGQSKFIRPIGLEADESSTSREWVIFKSATQERLFGWRFRDFFDFSKRPKKEKIEKWNEKLVTCWSQVGYNESQFDIRFKLGKNSIRLWRHQFKPSDKWRNNWWKGFWTFWLWESRLVECTNFAQFSFYGGL